MSRCESIKLTKEEAINARKNPSSVFVQALVNQTQEETKEKLKQLSNAVSIKEDKYFLFDIIKVAKRVSEVAKRAFGLQEQSINPDNDIKRQGGTAIHEVAQNIMNLYIDGKVTTSELNILRNKAMTGKFKISSVHFDQLKKLVEDVYNSIVAQQKEIDPKGKVNIYTEQFVMDFVSDTGGTLDVLAVFSDNTASIYDYKTSGRRDAIGTNKTGKTVVNNPFSFYHVRAFDLSMSTYKKILTERIGIKNIRQSRLLPVVVGYKFKPKSEQKEDSIHLPELETLIAYEKDNPYLNPIPVGGEQAKWEGINKLLEKQYRLLKDLSDKAYKKGVSSDEKQHLEEKIDKIESGIIKILVKEDIVSLLDSVKGAAVQAKTRLNEPKTKNDKENPSYLSNEELKDVYHELLVYDDLIADTYSYFKDLKQENPTAYNEMLEEFTKISSFYNHVLVDAKMEMGIRAEELVDLKYRDSKGHLLPFKELSFSDITFLKMSEINNPIFKAAWNIIQEAQYDTKKKFESLEETVYSKTEAVFKWAKENNMSRMDAWKILINEKTGNMYSKLRPEFWVSRKEAMEKKDINSIKFFKDNYEFKNKKTWEEDYKNRLESQKSKLKALYNNLEPSPKVSSAKQKEYYESALNKWIMRNDLASNGEAWYNKYNRKYITLKKEALEANYSDEYRKIKNIQPLSEFYDMWTEYMEEFADIFGISDYSKLPPNFIPNIRKEFVEHLNADSFNPMSAMKEIKDSLNVREEDVYIGNVNEDGLVRQIPILFLNKFFTEDGKADLTRKSYDLSASIVRFGEMAYNYEHMSKVEPKLLLLKQLLGEPSPEQGGIQATNRLDQRIKGKIQAYMTKEGRMTETYKLFEDITDAYLYGIRFKEQTPISGWNVAHLLSAAKNFNSQLRLSFAIVPASGAWVAGKVGGYVLSKKGIVYNTKQWNDTARLKYTDKKTYDKLNNYFDPENDDYLDRAIQKHKASVKNRLINSRTGFMPLRVADKDNMRDILFSMAQNYGIHKETGEFKRLDRKVWKHDADGSVTRTRMTYAETGEYTSIYDLVKNDKEVPKKAFIKFRAAVKSAGGSVFGNMNPDDIGRMETSLLVNQAMGFRTWMPAVVRERIGKARWNDETQALDIGRFTAYFGEYANTLTQEEIEDGKTFYMYAKHILVPNLSKLVVDLTTFGLAPRMGMKRVNETRAKIAYAKFIANNPGLKEEVTYEDFLEAKEAQIKAMLVELRIILGVMTMAMFFAGAGDDGKPRYYSNFATRGLYKIFSKAGSELTFMWNPTELVRLMKNPFPVTSLVVQLKNTIKNGIDESRDFVFNENSNQDKTPPGYYMFQWMYGAPQLMRFFEVYENMKRNNYSVYNMDSY